LIHQLATACKKYKGKVFTDKDRNVIKGLNDLEDEILETISVGDLALQDTQQQNGLGINVTEI